MNDHLDNNDLSILQQQETKEDKIADYETIILLQKDKIDSLEKENKRLRDAIFGHLPSSNVTNY